MSRIATFQTMTTAANKIYKKPTLPTVPPEPEPPLVMINGGAGVINPDFNEFMDLVPTYWHVEFGPVRIQEAGGPDSSPAVMMGPGYTYSFISQDLVFDEPPAGKTITLTVQARCPEADKAKIMIKLSDDKKVYSNAHPGDDKWHELKVSAQVPQDFQGTMIGIVLTHGGSPKKACWFDDVNLYVE